MTTVRLSDVIVPEVFASYMLKGTMQINAFVGAGVLVPDASLTAQLAGGGRTFNMPFWKDLDDTESDPASDDPASDATPGGITTGKDIALRQVRTRGWSTANLVRELAGDDPAKRIASRINEYWSRQIDAIAVSTMRGVFADNAANDSGDMINDIATDGAGAIADAERFSSDAVSDTAQTMGDAKRDLGLIIMHSAIHTRLEKQQMITFRPDADGKVWHSFYKDYRIHVSDECPAIAGANRTTYHTYLLGTGALAWGESPVAKPVELDNDASAADGAGIEEIWTRRQFALHPPGIKWTDSSVGGEFPINSELQAAANWDRVYAERKMIPMALLKTNG